MATLIDEDTEALLVTLEGITGATNDLPGQLTRHAVSDRSTRTDGIVIGPEGLTLTGVVPTTSGRGGPDAARVLKRRLKALRKAGTRIAVHLEGWDQIGGLMIESFQLDADGTMDPPISITFGEVLVADSRRITLSALPAATAGPPRADVADGLAERSNRGVVPTSAAAGIANSGDAFVGGLVNFLPGGI